MTSLKLTFQGETRRVKMSDRHFSSFDQLVYEAKTLFPAALQVFDQVDFVYTDEERERIVLSSQEEYDEALLILLHINPRVVRFEVKVPQSLPPPPSAPFHSCPCPVVSGGQQQQRRSRPCGISIQGSNPCASKNNRACGVDLNDLLSIATDIFSAQQYPRQQPLGSGGPSCCVGVHTGTGGSTGAGAGVRTARTAAHGSSLSQARKFTCCPPKVSSEAAPIAAAPTSGCCGANRRSAADKGSTSESTGKLLSCKTMLEQVLGHLTEDIDEMFLQNAIKQSLGVSGPSSDAAPASTKQRQQQRGASTDLGQHGFKIFEQFFNVPQQLQQQQQQQEQQQERKESSCVSMPKAGAGAGASSLSAADARAVANSFKTTSVPPPSHIETSTAPSGCNVAACGDKSNAATSTAAVAVSLGTEKKEEKENAAIPMVFVSDVSTPPSPRSPASTYDTDGEGEGREDLFSFVQVPKPEDISLAASTHSTANTATTPATSTTITSPLPAVAHLEPEVLWRQELNTLQEMGFTSIPSSVLVDILRTELVTPAQYGSTPSVRGMQRVVDQIAELM